MDHVAAKGIPILKINIEKPSERAVLEELLQLDKVLYVHFAPPCGTASAARDIKPGPPPLRSYSFPMGLPHLTFVQKTRVRKANFLYAWTCKVILILAERNVGWSVENPASSLMWITDPFVHLLKMLPNLIAFSFHTCMFAAPRKKDTAIWTSVIQLRVHLERKCDGSHLHLKWGKTSTGFATAEECAYNDTMCAAWAEALCDYALSKGYAKPPETIHEIQTATTQAVYMNKAILGCLPRGRKLLPFISEFLQPARHDISAMPSVQTMVIGKRIADDVTQFPKGSKLLRFVNADGGDDGNGNYLGLPTCAIIGIPRNPREFLEEACRLTHPTAMSMAVGELVRRNIELYNDPTGLKFRRKQCESSGKLVKLCAELKGVEATVKQNMPEHIRQVLAPKRIALFKKLLVDMDYPDFKIADEMAEGFPLCGWLPSSNVFPSRVRVPEVHEVYLRKLAKSLTARTLAATTSCGCRESDDKLWQATMDEVSDGFLSGPFEPDEMGAGCIASPRFGLQQKNKLRPIDNFSASQVNSATGLQDKFAVDSVDEICAMIKAWMQRSGPGLQLLGKTYKAYRQIAIRAEHLDLAWIAVWNPIEQRPAVFRMVTMPFGATASVGAFLRLSQAIKAIGISEGCLVWSSFYDDFVCICRAGTEVQTDRMVRLLFDSLGWQLSADDEKDKPFSEVFQALGVEFDMREVSQGCLRVGNTSSRKDELRDRIGMVLQENSLDPRDAESLRSRLLFADAQLFGRFSKMALQRISVGRSRHAEPPLRLEVKQSLEWFREHILTSPPRVITCEPRDTFFLFLDGACSEHDPREAWSGTSVGAVLADSGGRMLRYFGHVIDQSLVASWGRPEQTQHVFEAEVLPYALCLELWQDILRGTCLFAFLDNEAAKAAWIAGTVLSRRWRSR